MLLTVYLVIVMTTDNDTGYYIFMTKYTNCVLSAPELVLSTTTLC